MTVFRASSAALPFSRHNPGLASGPALSEIWVIAGLRAMAAVMRRQRDSIQAWMARVPLGRRLSFVTVPAGTAIGMPGDLPPRRVPSSFGCFPLPWVLLAAATLLAKRQQRQFGRELAQ